jgi:Tfp pilus assembly protein PilN
MRDYNFFQGFADEKKSGELKFIYVGAATAVILCILVGIYIINIFKIRGLEKNIDSMEKTIASKEFSRALEEKSKGEKKLNILNKYLASIDIINKSSIEEDYINTELIKTISNAVPQNISFQNMNIGDKIITMNGTSSTRAAIGELEHNLKSLGNFEDIHVSSITSDPEDEDNYSFNFTLTFQLKEDSRDETK